MIQNISIRLAIPFFSAILVNIIVSIFFTYYSHYYLINFSTLILISIFLIVSLSVKDVLNKILVYSWYFFYLCGILFLNSAATTDSKIRIPNVDADNFYILNLIALSLGFICSEKLYFKRKKQLEVDTSAKFNLPFLLFVLIFPFLFLFSTFSALGFIPMLTGESIVMEMYNYDYGPLYGYKFYLTISMLATLFYAFKSKHKTYYFSLAAVFALISLFDGKRAVLLSASISGMVLYYLYSSKTGKANVKLIIFVVLIIGTTYSVMSTLRSGKDNEVTNISALIQKFPFGVEYTDYVYSFETFSASSFKEYDFIGSALGSMMNSSILSIFGYDKQKMVSTGSAYIWMKLYGITFGIRTGIISELYFEFGYWSILLLFFLSFYFDYVSRKIYAAKTLFALLIPISLFGFNILLIVGQATVYFGTLTLIFYIYLIYQLSLFLNKLIFNNMLRINS